MDRKEDTPDNPTREEIQAFIKFAREKVISHQVGIQISLGINGI